LTGVSVSDGLHAQARAFTYDGRGFLTGESHPENGTVFYTYDATGKVLTKRLSQSSIFDLNFEYDLAERTTRVFSRQTAGQSTFRVMKEFEYADGNGYFNNKADYSMGKLQSATRHNYQGASDVKIVEKYHYGDTAGHLTDRTTEISLDGALKQSISQ